MLGAVCLVESQNFNRVRNRFLKMCEYKFLSQEGNNRFYKGTIEESKCVNED